MKKQKMKNLAKGKIGKPINVFRLEDLADKICIAMKTVECHQDVTIADDPVRRGHAFLNKGKEFLFLSVIEESYLPKTIRAMLKSQDRFWCRVEHGMGTNNYDPHECDNQLCMLLPNWAISHSKVTRHTAQVKKQKTISKRTLAMMDESMKNFAKGKVGKPIDIVAEGDLSAGQNRGLSVSKAIKKYAPIIHTFRQTPAQAKAHQQDMFKLNEIMLEKKTKKRLRSLLKARGWPLEDIEGAFKELWPKAD